MVLRFRCPCGQKLKTPEEMRGKRAKCVKCGAWLRVPESNTYETVAKTTRPKKRNKRHRLSEQEVFVEPVEVPQPPADTGKGRVLVADGSPDYLKSITDMLREHGYVVIETTDGSTAIEWIREKIPDAVVLDVKLERVGGFQVIAQVRDPLNSRNEAVWSLPIIMTAEKVRGRDKQYSLSLGVSAYLSKPVMPADLFPRLEKALKLRSR